jgi:NAD(P)-dependent dehydrogenase (short-subunit alcohol dehydrogenase family)
MADPASLAGRVVVVVGDDAARVGATVRVLAHAGARVAGFVGDPVSDAVGLTEMVAELFPEPSPEPSPGQSGDAPEPA